MGGARHREERKGGMWKCCAEVYGPENEPWNIQRPEQTRFAAKISRGDREGKKDRVVSERKKKIWQKKNWKTSRARVHISTLDGRKRGRKEESEIFRTGTQVTRAAGGKSEGQGNQKGRG